MEELLENYTFWSSRQLSDKIGYVKFEWCKDNGRGLSYCSLFIHGVVKISEFPEIEFVIRNSVFPSKQTHPHGLAFFNLGS